MHNYYNNRAYMHGYYNTYIYYFINFSLSCLWLLSLSLSLSLCVLLFPSLFSFWLQLLPSSSLASPSSLPVLLALSEPTSPWPWSNEGTGFWVSTISMGLEWVCSPWRRWWTSWLGNLSRLFVVVVVEVGGFEKILFNLS